jgi:hypothetical protein
VIQKESVLGDYSAVDPGRVKKLPADQQRTVEDLTSLASKNALATVAILPVAMLLGYIGLFVYFRRHGGYKVVYLDHAVSPDAKPPAGPAPPTG